MYSKAITTIQVRRWSSALTPERGRGAIACLSTKCNPTYATLPEVFPTEPNATGCAGKQVDRSLPENLAANDEWRLDGHDESRDIWRDRVSIPPAEQDAVPYIAVSLRSGMGFGCWLRLRGKLAVVLDTPGSHRVLI
ncbi:hypothetical protein B9Z19DRAFT_517782 [Tuber borchii]|uniref:Uncharacterized protein n=1 Tax=Tuber borchii TaxID=42251 RepID=A0A2T6ZDX7_TUBBO|nr:hypothetical protein B9Z19DRAFT_517782 [Tuber borchii]